MQPSHALNTTRHFPRPPSIHMVHYRPASAINSHQTQTSPPPPPALKIPFQPKVERGTRGTKRTAWRRTINTTPEYKIFIRISHWTELRKTRTRQSVQKKKEKKKKIQTNEQQTTKSAARGKTKIEKMYRNHNKPGHFFHQDIKLTAVILMCSTAAAAAAAFARKTNAMTGSATSPRGAAAVPGMPTAAAGRLL